MAMAVVLVVNLNDSVAESVKCTDNEVHYPDGKAEQKRKHVHDCAAGADHYFLHSQNVISLFNFFFSSSPRLILHPRKFLERTAQVSRLYS